MKRKLRKLWLFIHSWNAEFRLNQFEEAANHPIRGMIWTLLGAACASWVILDSLLILTGYLHH